jgi:hypothetical protein
MADRRLIDPALNVDVPLPNVRVPLPNVSVPPPQPSPDYVQQVMDEAQYSAELLDKMRQAQSTDRDNEYNE